jgi:hypothetical protein
MIRHIVMWKMKEEAGGATGAQNALLLKARLEACADLVPGIRASKRSSRSQAWRRAAM